MGYMNKRADIAVALLVLMALFLTVWATLTFLTHSDRVQTIIQDSRSVDSIYVKEKEIDFYVYDIMEKGTKGMGRGDSKQAFASSFEKELLKYKNETGFIIPELSQVEEQINENNIQITNNQVILGLSFKLEKTINQDYIFYNYNKKFTSALSN